MSSTTSTWPPAPAPRCRTTLKYFAERLPATFVYAGIDVESAGLFAGTRGRQIAGRFTVIPATPFDYGTSAQREQWRA